MDEAPTPDFSLDRRPNVLGGDDGYDLWFDLPPHEGDATTSELQTLCQGAMLLGHLGCRMGWDWATTIRVVDHLSAPFDGFLLLEVNDALFRSERFRRALGEGVVAAGLDPYKVRVTDRAKGDIHILGAGLPGL